MDNMAEIKSNKKEHMTPDFQKVTASPFLIQFPYIVNKLSSDANADNTQ